MKIQRRLVKIKYRQGAVVNPCRYADLPECWAISATFPIIQYFSSDAYSLGGGTEVIAGLFASPAHHLWSN